MSKEGNNLIFTFDKCDDSTFIKLGDNLREIRKRRGISQQALSEIVNRDRTGLSAYERGVKRPTINGLYEIADALGYKLKIKFEDMRDSMVDNKKDELVFSNNFINNYMSNMKLGGTFENNILIEANAVDDTWCINDFQTNKVVLESENGYIVELNYDTDTIKRFVQITITVNNQESEIEFITHRDLDGTYSLTDIEQIKKHIIECAAAEEITICCDQIEKLKSIVNVDNVLMMQYLNYLNLKKGFNLKDTDIINIIEELLPEYNDCRYIDTLASSDEKEMLEEEKMHTALQIASGCLNLGLIDKVTIKSIFELSYIFRLESAVWDLVYKTNRIENENIIANCNPNFEQDYCTDIISPMINDKIIECYNNISAIEGRNSTIEGRNEIFDELNVIINLLRAFNPNVNFEYIADTIEDAIGAL